MEVYSMRCTQVILISAVLFFGSLVPFTGCGDDVSGNGGPAEPGTVRFSLDGKQYTIENAMAGNNDDDETAITAMDGNLHVVIEFRGLTSGTYHAGSEDGAMMHFVDNDEDAPDSLTTVPEDEDDGVFTVNVSEYGSHAGEYVSGAFSGTMAIRTTNPLDPEEVDIAITDGSFSAMLMH